MTIFFPQPIFQPTNEPVRANKLLPVFQFIAYNNVGVLAAVLDYALIVIASLVASISYHLLVLHAFGDVAELWIGNYSALIFVLLAQSRGHYRPKSLRHFQLRDGLFAWIVMLLFITSLLFLFKISGSFSRGSIMFFSILGFGLVLSSRAIISINLREAVASGALAGQPAIVIGEREELDQSSPSRLLEAYGIKELGRFELPARTSGDHSDLEADSAVVDAAVNAARIHNAKQILLALKWTDGRRRGLVCERLRILPLPVLLLPDRFVGAVLAQATQGWVGETAIEIQRAPLTLTELAAKRVFDLTCAGLGLVVLSPLLAVISLAIMLDGRGPVVFRQRRKGFNGREFTIYKFRSMRVLEDGSTVRQAQRNDHRVTRLGRLLRVTSLDELPQLINVLRGNMSLIGPRPHATAHDDEFTTSIANYAFRHHVKPGITGWAQIHGLRGETPKLDLMMQRIEYDLWYINNWSLWLDLWISARTCLELARRRNAY
jgi:Undecaprenyl-phosphate glucose phosphotransferase